MSRGARVEASTGPDRRRGRDPHRPSSALYPPARKSGLRLAVGRVRSVATLRAVGHASEWLLDRRSVESHEPFRCPLRRGFAKDESVHEDPGRTRLSGVFDWGDFMLPSDAAMLSAFERCISPLCDALECSGCLAISKAARASGRPRKPPDAGGRDLYAPALRVGIDTAVCEPGTSGRLWHKSRSSSYTAVASSPQAQRPVQWTEWRTDQHTANTHGNERTFLDVTVPVKADGTMLGFSVRAIDDCGAFPRYEPLGCIIWAQVTPGCYRWRNIRVDFTQVCTNKSPVAPNRGYSRMQHLWLTERIVDIVAASSARPDRWRTKNTSS